MSSRNTRQRSRLTATMTSSDEDQRLVKKTRGNVQKDKLSALVFGKNVSDTLPWQEYRVSSSKSESTANPLKPGLHDLSFHCQFVAGTIRTCNTSKTRDQPEPCKWRLPYSYPFVQIIWTIILVEAQRRGRGSQERWTIRHNKVTGIRKRQHILQHREPSLRGTSLHFSQNAQCGMDSIVHTQAVEGNL